MSSGPKICVEVHVYIPADSLQTILSSLNASDGNRTGLTIDWIGRRLYWAVNTADRRSRIAMFDLAVQQEATVAVRSSVIHWLQVDPITK